MARVLADTDRMKMQVQERLKELEMQQEMIDTEKAELDGFLKTLGAAKFSIPMTLDGLPGNPNPGPRKKRGPNKPRGEHGDGGPPRKRKKKKGSNRVSVAKKKLGRPKGS